MIKFGTGGWRAIIGDEFTRYNIRLMAQGFANKYKHEGNKKPIIIGYDRRFLSKEALYWCSEVLAGNEIKCLFVNRSSPTPIIMHYVKKQGLNYGIMVTASHNPSLYNGFKFFIKEGKDADVETTKDIEKYIEKVNYKEIKSITIEEARKRNLFEDIYPMNAYLDDILEMIDVEAIRKADLRIMVDPMYGVSGFPLKTILLTARCYVDTINSEHDTLFGGKMPTPSEERLGLLKHRVKEWKFDIGIATDGDADRLGLIDDKGGYLHANEILALIYYYFLEYKGLKGDIVRNIATSHMLDKIAAHYGQKCYEVPVGFKYISAAMHDYNCLIGGESSGGLAVRGHINGKDGIFSAALIVEMLAKTQKKLSVLLKEMNDKFGIAYDLEKDLMLSRGDIIKFKELIYDKKIMPDFTHKIDKVSYKDGCKVYFENGGFVICRFSGTEPVLRIFSEMATKKSAQEVIDRWVKLLKEEGM